ncbi:MAG: hypothetical protein KDC95_14000 [Planctomycetes bacterium]|nr:hypothetical protein [Planctomycetota bacterium]
MFFSLTTLCAGSVLVAQSNPRIVRDIQPGGLSSIPDDFVDFFGRLMFRASAPGLGHELHVTDGTADGTVLVTDLYPGLSSGFPREPVLLGGRAFFSARRGNNEGTELWASDGTKNGTVLVKDISTTGSGQPRNLVAGADTIYFTAATPATGEELWASNGSDPTTRMVLDIVAGSTSSAPRDLTVAKNRVFFTASTPGEGRELWVSDGTPQGTHLVLDIVPGAASSGVSNLVALDSVVYFVARHPTKGAEVWISNGTASGTGVIKDIFEGGGSSNPVGLTRVDDTIYFFATDGKHGAPDLWRTEPVVGSTKMVADLTPAGRGALFGETLAVGPLLFFAMRTAAEGLELWRSDGTPLGTGLVMDIRPGPEDGAPHNMTAYGARRLVFAANDGATGVEPWITQGLTKNTVRLGDLRAGPASSSPGPFLTSGSILYFRAQTDLGSELWRYDFGAVTTPIGRGCGRDDRIPTMLTSDPVLGRNLEIQGRCAFGNATCVVQLGVLARYDFRILGCQPYLDLLVPYQPVAFGTANGGRWGATLFLPNQPSLAGLRVALWTWIFPTDAKRGFDTTNAVQLTLGQ